MHSVEYLRTSKASEDYIDLANDEMPNLLVESIQHFPYAVIDKAQMEIVGIAREFIHRNFAGKISVEQIAKKVFVSQYHFSRIFKRLTNYSPYQYLLHVRLEHAKKLMQQKELSIKEITYLSGFSSIDHFSAAFSKKNAMCPSSYRKNFCFF